MPKAKSSKSPEERKKLNLKTVTILLTECGYRCAVPTCRNILALDMHHIWQVSSGGGDSPSNLIALCPTCHALYHRGTILPDSIYAYKSMLISLSQAFDLDAVDKLLFLCDFNKDALIVSGDGAMHFFRLAVSNLVDITLKANNNWEIVTYAVNITEKGRLLINAWRSGDRTRLSLALQPSNQPELSSSEPSQTFSPDAESTGISLPPTN